MKKLIIQLILLQVSFISVASAQQFYSLSKLELYNKYLGEDYSGRFKDLSGVEWVTEDLYKNIKNIKLSGLLSFDYFDGKIVHTLHSSFDFGKSSAALKAKPILALGYGRTFYLKDQLILKWAVENVIQLGGKVQQIACKDDFQREFHCGTAIPWTSYKPKLKNKFPILFSIQMIKFF